MGPRRRRDRRHRRGDGVGKRRHGASARRPPHAGRRCSRSTSRAGARAGAPATGARAAPAPAPAPALLPLLRSSRAERRLAVVVVPRTGGTSSASRAAPVCERAKRRARGARRAQHVAGRWSAPWRGAPSVFVSLGVVLVAAALDGRCRTNSLQTRRRNGRCCSAAVRHHHGAQSDARGESLSSQARHTETPSPQPSAHAPPRDAARPRPATAAPPPPPPAWARPRRPGSTRPRARP